MSQLDITAVILTYNESIHIERCINSVSKIVSDVVIVDSFSTDNTVEIAASLGARVFQNAWINHSHQFNWGLENTNICTEWVFRLDADEYLESGEIELNELSKLEPDVTGIYIDRKYYFLGKWIKFGGMYPISHLRIWRHAYGRVENRWMDERTVLMKGSSIHMPVNIVDDNGNSLSWWIDKHNNYATREMIDSMNLKYNFMPVDTSINKSGGKQAIFKRVMKERFYAKIPLFIRPFLYFLYRYFLRLGILDGSKGFVFHFMQSFWYRMLVDCKIYEAKIWLKGATEPDLIKKILIEKTKLDI